MTNMSPTEKTEQARFYVLSKLTEIGVMNMLEIGFTATAQVIRNMAARGYIRVTVEITPRGAEWLAAEKAKRLRIAAKAAKEKNLAAIADRRFG